jgi:hypothetical protein
MLAHAMHKNHNGLKPTKLWKKPLHHKLSAGLNK